MKPPFNPHYHPYNKYSLVISVISQDNSSWIVTGLDGQINSWCYSKKHFIRWMNPHEIQWQFFPINSPFVTNLDGQIKLIFMSNPHFDPENCIPMKYPLNTHKFPLNSHFPYNSHKFHPPIHPMAPPPSQLPVPQLWRSCAPRLRSHSTAAASAGGRSQRTTWGDTTGF